MCVVSMVINEGMKIWPNVPVSVPSYPWAPNLIPNSPIEPTVFNPEPLKDWVEMLKRAQKLDVATNQPDCEDPAKVEWAEKLCNRLIEIGSDLIRETVITEKQKNSLGVELIQIAKDIKDTLDLS